MKKFLAFILAIVYLSSSIGATINIHYCMGKKYAAELINHNKCGKCGAKNKEPGCCKTEHRFFKIKDNHVMAARISSPFVPFALIHSFGAAFRIYAFVSPQVLINSVHAPPLYSGIPAYISNCIYRI